MRGSSQTVSCQGPNKQISTSRLIIFFFALPSAEQGRDRLRCAVSVVGGAQGLLLDAPTQPTPATPVNPEAAARPLLPPPPANDHGQAKLSKEDTLLKVLGGKVDKGSQAVPSPTPGRLGLPVKVEPEDLTPAAPAASPVQHVQPRGKVRTTRISSHAHMPFG